MLLRRGRWVLSRHKCRGIQNEGESKGENNDLRERERVLVIMTACYSSSLHTRFEKQQFEILTLLLSIIEV